MNDTAEQLKKISGLFNTDKIISPEDIQGVLGGIVKILALHKKSTTDMNEDSRQTLLAIMEKIVDKHEEHKGTIDKAVTTQLNSHNFEVRSLIDQINQSLEMVKSKIPKDGNPGKDSDPEEVAAIVMKNIKIPKGMKNAIISPVDMANSLESLENEDRLSADAIDDVSFADKVKNLLKNHKVIVKIISEIAVGGARFLSYLADVAIVNPTDGQALIYNAATKTWKNGTASGSSINVAFGEVVAGSATTFTLAHTPIGTISIAANGQVLTLATDYTISGAVVTMLTSWSAGAVVASYQY